MEELNNMFAELNRCFKLKSDLINERENTNSYLHSELINRKRDIEIFKNSINQVSDDPFLKSEIIANFRMNAERIKNEINKIR